MNKAQPGGQARQKGRKNMNIEAIGSAEDFARKVLTLSPEGQTEFYKMLPGLGFTEDEVKNLMEYVGLYHMFTDSRYYKKIQATVGAMICETYNIK